MNCFRYKIEHDFGFAPNPFHGTLSLATCKGDIRKNKNLQLGDWIVGLGSKSMGNLHHIVFAMKVEEKLTFDQYWNDARFLCKKPNLNGSLIEIYGDNVYHTDESTGKVIQENCAHSKDNGIVDEGHYKRDVEGQYVLLSKTLCNSGKLLFVPYTKDFGRITQFWGNDLATVLYATFCSDMLSSHSFSKQR